MNKKARNTDYLHQLVLLPPPWPFTKVDGETVECLTCGARLRRRTLESVMGKHFAGSRHAKKASAT